MVENIQLGMERMISELEDYKNRGIFSPDELRKIVETRRKYELRLQRPEKKLLDFIRYIKSECILEKIRDKRVREKNAGTSLHDMKISKKIVELYRSALYRFNDPKIISQFTAYVIEKKMYGEMKNVFAECCTRNPLDVDLWIYCGFKLFEVGDIESSRAMFLKGIRMNSKNTRIRIEFFRMEVMYVEKIEALNREIGLDSDDKDDLERGEVAFAIFADCLNGLSFTEKEIEEILEISKSIKELRERIEEHIKDRDI
ncbi:hypothetical protein EHEL_070030 [Encephalitozoon hellem ATCC 50504]|uniref:U3 small nucleolar RNA-associated protein 6 n=1 Tax=Encephalitozoon hellem TaxID=27973 RepID=A0A9Q9CCM3_ENCHE|nr:uncharacterized protein EHEL_070030 [Encephalitozoon hellem ATCC 50504]AFM98531.1 hypothetical protein EHEL_070030 [Encephalitozoon hellem ATCC 50504]UTX43474.1 U3 small nucleolar RNA-associated protein 6 [Encephalitozoon hellem]WEL38948.1 U3 small nucleolar RNA-associated protein 6 [Encephalitozoon hellem]|eukprot:XP_003887512.1 hypothetical protein EHEL_070030 [Encephalitozoon hellem ATCC 50504]